MPGGQLCHPVPVLPSCSCACEEQPALPWRQLPLLGARADSPGYFPDQFVLGKPPAPLWRFQMIEIRGRFRLKVICAFAGLGCFTTDQAAFCHCHAGRSRMLQAWDLPGFNSTPSAVRSRLLLNYRMHLTVQQKYLGFMMCGAFFLSLLFFS